MFLPEMNSEDKFNTRRIKRLIFTDYNKKLKDTVSILAYCKNVINTTILFTPNKSFPII